MDAYAWYWFKTDVESPALCKSGLLGSGDIVECGDANDRGETGTDSVHSSFS